MALLTAKAILDADDLATEDVEVPEWNGSVRVRALTGFERDKLEDSVVEQRGKKTKMNMANFRAKLVAATVIDDTGHLLFEESDLKALSGKNASALDKIATVSSRLSGMSPEDVEELTGGFEDDPSGGSTTD